ncbi:MAG: hypothetical protein AB9891_20880 [Anaerolineaceae bacterium]
MHSALLSNQYLLKRQVFALKGTFRIYDKRNDQMVLFSQQKMFKLKEDIRIFSDETRSQEILHINARSIIDFSAAYDVFDSSDQTLVGTLRRKGLRSIIRDEWEVLNPAGEIIGILQEDNQTLALLRRLVAGSLIPQDYDLTNNGRRLVDIKQRFNLFRYELDIDFLDTPTLNFDRRLGIAAGILLAAIEGRQE